MKKYNVVLEETVEYTVEVLAEDEDAAQVKAADLWAECDTPTNTYSGYGKGVEAIDVELLS